MQNNQIQVCKSTHFCHCLLRRLPTVQEMISVFYNMPNFNDEFQIKTFLLVKHELITYTLRETAQVC